jgi:LCP family protein required for cell wall assembly
VTGTVETVPPRRASGAGFVRRYALALGVVVAVVVVGIIGVNLLISQKLASVSKVDLQLSSAPAGGANYLLVGSDSRSFVSNAHEVQQFGSEQGNNGQRSDAIMILHAEPNGSSLLVSIPRDLWVSIPGQGMAKINAAFDSGPQKLVDTIQNDLNVPIHHYVEVNFDTFRKIVNAVGSVPVYFPAATRDSFSDLSIPLPGCYHLTGDQALAYVRSRDTEVFNTTTQKWTTLDAVPDIGRIGRQQVFIRQLATLALDTVLSNPLKATAMVDSVTSDLTLDQGFSNSNLFALVNAFRKVDPSDPSQVQSTTLPWQTGPNQGGQEVLYLKQPDADQVLSELRNFNSTPPANTPGASTPSAAPSTAAVHVRVLNASGVSGAAARTLAAL